MGKFILIIVFLIIVGGGFYAWTKGLINFSPKSPVAGKIVVGTDATYPPLEYINEDGQIVGFDVDLAREIAKDLKVDLEVKNIPFDKIFDSLKSGEVDLVISSVTITTERQKEMFFSTPYLNAGQVVVVKSGSSIKDVNGLDNKRVGVQGGTTSETQAKIYTEPEIVVLYKDYVVAQKDLLEGKIDAIIIDYPAGISMSQNSGGEITVIGNPFTSEFYGVVAPLSEEELIKSVNKSISKLKAVGKLTEIERLWFKR